MINDTAARTARVLTAHQLSLPEHYLMISAGYRVAAPPDAFVKHAFAASEGDRRDHPSLAELTVALERLQARGLLTCLTVADVQGETRRRAASAIPEVMDVGYGVGIVDFTPRGFAVHREVIHSIFGEDHVTRSDAGFNLYPEAGRLDVYAVSSKRCREIIEMMVGAGGDLY